MGVSVFLAHWVGWLIGVGKMVGVGALVGAPVGYAVWWRTSRAVRAWVVGVVVGLGWEAVFFRLPPNVAERLVPVRLVGVIVGVWMLVGVPVGYAVWKRSGRAVRAWVVGAAAGVLWPMAFERIVGLNPVYGAFFSLLVHVAPWLASLNAGTAVGVAVLVGGPIGYVAWRRTGRAPTAWNVGVVTGGMCLVLLAVGAFFVNLVSAFTEVLSDKM